MLILSNEDVTKLLTMEDCLQALSAAYQAFGEGRALNIPRLDSLLEHQPDLGRVYSFKVMGGAVIGGVQALRINSDVIHWPEVDGNRRRVKIPAAKGHWVGLVYLFDPATGMPLAIFPDGVLQHFRVGAANGLAARYLAPTGVQEVALLGTGWQAETQLLAFDTVVKPREVRVFSPNPEHREAFCARMQGCVQAALRPVADAESAVRGAQVVAAATNSMQPVLRPEWIQPGVHFSTIKAQEVDRTMVQQTHLYLHTRKQAKADVQSAGNVPEFEKEAGWWRQLDLSQTPDLVDLVCGRVAGRQSADEVTLFVNNVGMGLQFAAVGALVWQRARQLGIGHELPDEWFIENVHP